MRLTAIPRLTGVARSGVMSLGLKALSGVIGLLFSYAVTRLLDASDAGAFFLLVTLTTICAVVVQLGFDQFLTKNIAIYSRQEDWGAVRYIYIRAAKRVLIASLLVLLALGYFSHEISVWLFQGKDFGSELRIMLLAVLPFSMFWLHAHCFLGAGRIVFYQIFLSPAVVIFFLLLSCLLSWLWGASIQLLVISYLLSALIVAIIAMGVWRPMISGVTGRTVEVGYASARRFFLLAIMGLFISWFCQLSLGFWGTTKEVAIFTVALRVSAVISVVLTAVNSVVLPRFASLYSAGDISGLRGLAIHSTRAMIGLCAPAILLILFFPEKIMALFGEEFSPYGGLLVIMACGQFVNVATGSVGALLNMTDNEDAALKANLISIFVVTLAVLVMVPLYGAFGAAISQALGLSVQMLSMTIYARRRLGFAPINIFSKT